MGKTRGPEFSFVAGEVIALTERAVLLRIEHVGADDDDEHAGEEHWLARSNLYDPDETFAKYENVTLSVKTWVLKDKELL